MNENNKKVSLTNEQMDKVSGGEEANMPIFFDIYECPHCHDRNAGCWYGDYWMCGNCHNEYQNPKKVELPI